MQVDESIQTVHNPLFVSPLLRLHLSTLKRAETSLVTSLLLTPYTSGKINPARSIPEAP